MKNVKEEVVKKIKEENVKPRSKGFFTLLKYLGMSFLVLLFIAGVFLFNLTLYLPRRGMMAQGPLFARVGFGGHPWGLAVLTVAIIGLAVFFYTKYEGGYKKSLFWTTLVIGGLIVGAGIGLYSSRINERMEKAPRLKRMYDWGEGNFVPGRRDRLRQKQMPMLRENMLNLKDFN